MPTVSKETVEAGAEVKAVRETLAAAPAVGSEDALELQKRLSRRADLLKTLEAKPAAEEKPRGPDAWLERRLRTFERGMTALETRQEQVETTTRTALGAQDARLKDLESAIAAIEQRTADVDTSERGVADEFRRALNQISLRLECLERPARPAGLQAAVDAPAALAPEPVISAATESAPPEKRAAEVPASETEPNAAREGSPASYLDAVRKNVAVAHSGGANREAEIAARFEKQQARRRRYVFWSIGTAVAFVAAAGISFSKGVYDGRHEVLANVVRSVSHKRPIIAAIPVQPAPSPLDRLTQRAQAGDAEAELLVGERYLNGEGTAKNPSQAFDWLKRAAVHGQPLAQYLVATLYQSGAAGIADPAKAMGWYEASALQGNRKAMHDLAVAYAQGQGAPKNLAEAVRWFSRAAQLGYVDSQFNLAVLYERGAGVPQSLLDAYKWYVLAARQGDMEAKTRAEAIRTQLSADDLTAAEHAAAAFQPAPYSRIANVTPAG